MLKNNLEINFRKNSFNSCHLLNRRVNNASDFEPTFYAVCHVFSSIISNRVRFGDVLLYGVGSVGQDIVLG